MKKFWIHLFITLFVLLSLVPLLGLCLFGPAAPAANEVQATLPRLRQADGEWNIDYLSELSDYVSDAFWLRLECITGWNGLTSALANSSLSKDVIPGKSDWLFYRTAADEAAGLDRLTERQLWCCARNLYLMQSYAGQQGAQFVFTAPNGKYDLYGEYLPYYITIGEDRNIDRLQELLAEMGVTFCDLYEPFARQGEILYWHTDSHWNGRGAALAADEILETLGKEGGWFAGAFVAAGEHRGDLYAMLYPAGTQTEPDWLPAGGFSFVYESDFRSEDDMEIVTDCAAGEGRLLMYRDSFGRNLYPYLAERFEQGVFCRKNNFELFRIPQEGFSHVVVEIGVKNLIYLLQYPAVYPSLERDVGVLTGTETVSCQLSTEADCGELPGHTKISGALSGTAVDSPVFLRVDGLVYEAMPTDTGFTAYVEGTVEPGSIEVFAQMEE